jgi:hypothetical protein
MCPERIIDSVVAREGASYEQEIGYFPGLSSNGAKKLPQKLPPNYYDRFADDENRLVILYRLRKR